MTRLVTVNADAHAALILHGASGNAPQEEDGTFILGVDDEVYERLKDLTGGDMSVENLSRVICRLAWRAM